MVLLPDELDREEVDHPVTGDPIGWELLVRVGAGCVGAGRDGVGLDGAGRPLIGVPEVEEREGLTVERVGVTVRLGLDVLGRLVERVGEEMLLVDVERVRVGADGRVTVRLDELDRRALEERCVEDRCVEDRCAEDLCADERCEEEARDVDRELPARDPDEVRWTVRWAGSGWVGSGWTGSRVAATVGEPPSSARATAAADSRRTRWSGARLVVVGDMVISGGAEWGRRGVSKGVPGRPRSSRVASEGAPGGPDGRWEPLEPPRVAHFEALVPGPPEPVPVDRPPWRTLPVTSQESFRGGGAASTSKPWTRSIATGASSPARRPRIVT